MAVMLVVAISLPRRSGSDDVLLAVMWMLYAYFTVYVPKLLFCIVSWIGLLPRLWRHRSWRGFNAAGVALASVAFVAMWWGALVNRLDYKIRHADLCYEELPAEFDGFTFVQLSDLHVGSYGDDTTYVSRIVDVVNGLHPDAIMFTGDIVNRRSRELVPFVTVLSRLSAPEGVYSVLGNHDYGDYSAWPSPEAKQANMDSLLAMQHRMGWRLLNNETEFLRRGADSIAVVGVENWGDPPFTTYGDLHAAYPALADSTFKILLSHNPAHWDAEIEPSDTANVAITLSGHTHAMQMKVGSLSPSSLRYRHWAGLYTAPDGRRRLYVNIGLGTVAIPSRIGATPEITFITLHKKASR